MPDSADLRAGVKFYVEFTPTAEMKSQDGAPAFTHFTHFTWSRGGVCVKQRLKEKSRFVGPFSHTHTPPLNRVKCVKSVNTPPQSCGFEFTSGCKTGVNFTSGFCP